MDRCSTALIALFALTSCNKVFGLDEGTLDPYAGGFDATGAGSEGGSGDGGAPTTSFGGAGACTLEVGLENGGFDLWSSSDVPDRWTRSVYNTQLTLSTLPSSSEGLSMVLTDVSTNAYAGISQPNGFIEWDQCVSISGAARRSSGAGRLTATATFGGMMLQTQVPTGTDFTPFAVTCNPNRPLDSFNFRLLVDEVPEGGTVTMQVAGVRFDEVCCQGGEPQCVPEE